MECYHRFRKPLLAFCGILFALAGCNSRKPTTTETAEPEVPPIQALPRQSLKGLNIELKSDSSASIGITEWTELPLIEPERIGFADSFSGMNGFKCRLSNKGKERENLTPQARNLDVYSSSDAIGDFSVSMFEDTSTIGADGKPGIMAISWDMVPKMLGYTAFVYSGPPGRAGFNIAPIINAKTADDLSGIQFRFRYKGMNNSVAKNVSFIFDFRLGFEGEHNFENRLDLGRVVVTSEWKNHIVDLGSPSNVDRFLMSIARLGTNPLSLAVSHVGSVNNFQAGDTLLLDDIELIVPQRLAGLMKSSPPAIASWIESSELEPHHIVFADSFADAKGGRLQVSNGIGKMVNTSRDLFVFSDPDLSGDCTLTFLEDAESLGPDGKPGVLSIRWSVVPKKMNYSGFTYMGSRLGPGFNIEKIKTANSRADLQKIYIRFQCKASNPQAEGPCLVKVGFRLEPVGVDQYANRLDLGTISLTEEWTRYQRELSLGTNSENFLRMVRSQPDAGLRMIWGQVGGIESYRSGDTVQIDEIEVIVLPSDSQDATKD